MKEMGGAIGSGVIPSEETRASKSGKPLASMYRGLWSRVAFRLQRSP